MVIYTDEDFKRILLEYPDEVTKEQFYRLCHVSKRIASYYLEQGFLPCEKKNTKTHKYLIKTADIVAFLKTRQENPFLYQAPAGMSRKPIEPQTTRNPLRESPIDLGTWQVFLSEVLSGFSDVCKVQELSRMCGYSRETILKWCEAGKFIFFDINRTYQIPKKSFIEFMASLEFATITQKQPKHLELLLQFENWLNPT